MEDRSATASISLTVVVTPTEIWEIQGASHVSPMVGADALGVEGIVTATSGNGFWMTDPTPDADPATSDGIFAPSTSLPVAVGDGVEVSGTVTEFRPGGSGSPNLATTEIVSPTVTVVSAERVPTTVIGVDRFANKRHRRRLHDERRSSRCGLRPGHRRDRLLGEPRGHAPRGPRRRRGRADERLRRDRRRQPGPTLPAHGRPEAASSWTTSSATPGRRLGDFNPERVILDDAIGQYTRRQRRGRVRDRSGRRPRLQLRELQAADQGRPRPMSKLAPEVAAPAGVQVRRLPPSMSRISHQPTRRTRSIGSRRRSLPTCVRLTSSPSRRCRTTLGQRTTSGRGRPTGSDSSRRSPRLADRSTSTARSTRINNADGGQPGGNIRVGSSSAPIRPPVRRPVGGTATTDTDVVSTPNGKGARLTASPGRIFRIRPVPGRTPFATRKSLAGEFQWRGETVFIVVNHSARRMAISRCSVAPSRRSGQPSMSRAAWRMAGAMPRPR